MNESEVCEKTAISERFLFLDNHLPLIRKIRSYDLAIVEVSIII